MEYFQDHMISNLTRYFIVNFSFDFGMRAKHIVLLQSLGPKIEIDECTVHIRNNVLHVLYANKKRLKTSCATSCTPLLYESRRFYCHDLLEALDEVLKNSIDSFVDDICEVDLKAIIDLLIFV